jgi:hypothetical protein
LDWEVSRLGALENFSNALPSCCGNEKASAAMSDQG